MNIIDLYIIQIIDRNIEEHLRVRDVKETQDVELNVLLDKFDADCIACDERFAEFKTQRRIRGFEDIETPWRYYQRLR